MMTRQEFIDRQRQGFEEVAGRVTRKLGGAGLTTSHLADNFRLHVPAEQVLEVLRFLRDECGFEMLVEMSAADYLEYPGAKDRYGVWYALLRLGDGQRIIVKTFVNDPDPTLPSAFPLWKGADWMEREVYDMYGIVFEGHPDLRRVLLPDEFTAFPLRKDYPMRGRGERHNFESLTRAET